MIILFATSFLFLAFLGYKLNGKYIAPTALIPSVWGALLLLYGILDLQLNDLSNTVLYVLLLWVVFSLFGSYVFSTVNLSLGKPKILKVSDFNPSIRSLYYYIAIIGTVVWIYIAYKQITTMSISSNIFTNLRYANIHSESEEVEHQYGIFKYTFNIAFVSLLIELFSLNKNKYRVKILIILNILLSFITMAKTSFLFLFLSILFSRIFKYKISLKKIIVVSIILFLLMFGIHHIRSEVKNSIAEIFEIYFFAGLPALDKIVENDMRVTQPGIMSFRFFYNVNTRLFGGNKVAREFLNNVTQGGYVFVPLPTNVFTVIGPFWWDFGWLGVIAFGFINGALAGILYNKSKQKQTWAIIAYSYIACTLILQFFGEYIFTNLSNTIQIIALLLFAYNLKWVFKWR